MKEDLLGTMREKLVEQRGVFKSALVTQLKSQVPKAGPSSMEQIWALDTLGIMDMMQIRNEYGDAALNELIGSIEKLRADGRRDK